MSHPSRKPSRSLNEYMATLEILGKLRNKDFQEKCSNHDYWTKEASAEKRHLIETIMTFLRVTLKYSETYPALEREIINRNTADVVYGSLQENFRYKVIYETRFHKCRTKDYLIKMKEIFDDEHKATVNTCNHKKVYKKQLKLSKPTMLP